MATISSFARICLAHQERSRRDKAAQLMLIMSLSNGPSSHHIAWQSHATTAPLPPTPPLFTPLLFVAVISIKPPPPPPLTLMASIGGGRTSPREQRRMASELDGPKLNKMERIICRPSMDNGVQIQNHLSNN